MNNKLPVLIFIRLHTTINYASCWESSKVPQKPVGLIYTYNSCTDRVSMRTLVYE